MSREIYLYLDQLTLVQCKMGRFIAIRDQSIDIKCCQVDPPAYIRYIKQSMYKCLYPYTVFSECKFVYKLGHIIK